jgi:hypothetical protein
MAKAFDTDALLAAFDRIGAAAVARGARLDFAVYGGSALMLASSFRFVSEDVAIAPLERWPDWLIAEVKKTASSNGWAEDWLNDAVGVHLSRTAGAADHILFESFPREGDEIGLRIFVPTAEYMLALKLKALRLVEPAKGAQEGADVLALMQVCGVRTADEAVAALARYFPVSAAAPEKLRFLL